MKLKLAKILVILCTAFVTNAFAESRFLVVSDPHLNSAVTTTTFYSSTSDTGLDLWQASLNAMKTTVDNNPVDFVLLLGDLPAHGMKGTAKTDSEKQVLTDLRTTFGTTPIIYVPGNNDAIGGNYHSYTDLKIKGTQRPDQIDVAGKWPAHGLNKCNLLSQKHACIIDDGPDQSSNYFYGSYSVYPTKSKDLRVIALNSVPFIAHANTSYLSDDKENQATAIANLTTWLEAELASAEAKNEKVIIAMHIPPGLDAYKGNPMWEATAQDAFNASIAKHHNAIITVFYGHTHYDELRLMRTTPQGPSTLLLSSPAIDTGHGNNPGFKLVSLNDDRSINNVVTIAGGPSLLFQAGHDFRADFLPHCKKDATLHDCLDQLDASHDLYDLMKTHYAVGNPGYTHWDNVDDAMHIDATSNE